MAASIEAINSPPCGRIKNIHGWIDLRGYGTRPLGHGGIHFIYWLYKDMMPSTYASVKYRHSGDIAKCSSRLLGQ